MKHLFVTYILMIFFIGCKEPIKQKESKLSIDKDLVTAIVQEKINHHQKEYRHNLSLYNEKYVLKIIPNVNDSNELEPILSLYKIDCCITEQIDSIFKEQISQNLIMESVREVDIKVDAMTKENLSSQYVLDKIVYHNVRADRLYFEGTLRSKDNETNLKAIFNLRYRDEKSFGELSVNQVSPKGWGRNKGDEDGFNQIKLIDPEECGISDSQYSQEKAIKERRELLIKIQQELSSMSSSAWKFELRNDSIQVAEKIRFNGKAEYNIAKTPIYKLANITISGQKITLYTLYKSIYVNRFGYKPLNTSQVEITSDLMKIENIELANQLKRLSQINCFLGTL